jgi:hypothetical protein
VFCGAVQAHNPFLEQLQEEDEEEDELELYVEELVLELAKGPGGYGMDITESGHVVGNTAGGVAEAAGARARACTIAREHDRTRAREHASTRAPRTDLAG